MLKKFKQKISGKIIMLAAIFIIIALQFFYAKPAYADNILLDLLGSAVKGVLNIASAPIFMLLGTIVVGVSWLVGQISTLLVYLLFYVASYNSFIKEGIVGYGWVIVRDICNMFFILILLIIAFATILRQENYNAKKLLPKLLIMAVLINFSKTICGLAIDFSQVIMLTFVNGLNAGDSFFGHGALVNALGLNKLLSIKTATVDTLKSAFVGNANPMSVFGSLLFGFILLIIACIVVGIYTMVLMFRIVMLWILIILSPLAFLAMAIPAGAKYASQWTNEFTKYLIVGPAMAFFLWLALLLSQASFTTNFNLNQSIGAAKTGFDSQILTEMGNPQNLANFIVVVIFLLAGLMVAQQMGVAGGGAAGNAVAKIKATGIGAAKLPFKGASLAAGYGARKFAKHAFEIRPTKIVEGIKESFERKRKMDELAVRKRGAETLGKGGLRGVFGGMGAGQDWANRYVQLKGFKNIYKDIKAPGRIKPLKEEYSAKEKEIENKSEEIAKFANFQTLQEKEANKEKSKNLDTIMADLQTKIGKATGDDAEKLEKEYEGLLQTKIKLDEGINIPVSLDKGKLIEEQDKMKKELRGIQLRIRNVSLPKSLEARAAYRTSINEEKAKLKDVTLAEELMSYYADAKQNKDKYRMAAITEKLFNDANGNEILNEYGYNSDAVGLHQFIQKEMIDSKLMSQPEALLLQNDLSEAAERVNHWEMARTVGINQFGELESLIKKDTKTGKWDDSAHAHAAAAEIFKIDPQQIMRMLNRLAFGGERPDGKGGRTFSLSTLGMILTNGLSQAFQDHKNRILTNTAFNLSQPHVQNQMKEAGVSDQTINIFYQRGTEKGKTLNPGEILAELKQKELHLKSNNNSKKG